ncbi:hypothetical protein [Burkholderia stabilis]|uniref:hypothetical protein n=1 Tax=Burkholderia stabilis TaxID=95485 RepID=UPI001F0C4180|nr:hypothetical protein [Burkholderia stabilis]
MINVRMASLACRLPTCCVYNDDPVFAQVEPIPADWRRFWGIESRYMIDPDAGETELTLAEHAAREALHLGDMDASELDLVLFNMTSPFVTPAAGRQRFAPRRSRTLRDWLGAKRALDADVAQCGHDVDLLIVNTLSPDCHDLSQAHHLQPMPDLQEITRFDIRAQFGSGLCGMEAAPHFLMSGGYRYVLLVCAEALSRRIDTCLAGRNRSLPLVGVDFAELSELPFYPVKPGRQLDIGEGMKIHAFALLGRSSCQLGYYCPQLDVAFVSGAMGEFQGLADCLLLVLHDLFAYRHSLQAIEQLRAGRLAPGHHGVLASDRARLAVRQPRICLDACEGAARAVRGHTEAAHRLAREWTARCGARCARVVLRHLHLKSMARMIDLFHCAE